jgi:hypothetical protein
MVNISYLWTVALIIEATATLWLLLSAPLATFIIERTLVTWVTTGLSVGGSIWMLRGVLRGQSKPVD